MRSVHMTISGQVQGVGYRAWFADEARRRGLNGWVRNRSEGTVEAVLAGPAEPLEAFLNACHGGPAAAEVDAISIGDWHEPVQFGMKVLPTA